MSEEGRDEAGELATHAGPPVEEIDGRAAAPRPARDPLAVDDHVEPTSFGERRARAPRAAAAAGREEQVERPGRRQARRHPAEDRERQPNDRAFVEAHGGPSPGRCRRGHLGAVFAFARAPPSRRWNARRVRGPACLSRSRRTAWWLASMMPEPGSRISDVRFKQLQATGAHTVVTACPFCSIMLKGAQASAGADTQFVDLMTYVNGKLQPRA